MSSGAGGGNMHRPVERPTLRSVLQAEKTIRPHLDPTPALRSPGLDEILGTQAVVKCENLLPIRAFKVRGGINLVATETRGGSREISFVTASTGNHGQSISYASRIFGSRAYIYVPENPNPVKAQAIRRLGAKIVETGRDYDQAREKAEAFAQEKGHRYVHPVEEPLLIAGVGTATLELLSLHPDLEMLFVPVGAGSGACGASIVAHAVNPSIRVVGVQAQGAPSVHNSWREGRLISAASVHTVAEGLATRVPYAYPLEILREHLHDFLLVSDGEMHEAIRLLYDTTGQIAEEAGAASLAGALKLGQAVSGRKIGLILSGGNVPRQHLAQVLQGGG